MKSLIFLSLYIVAGVSGWAVYHYTLVDDGAATMDIAAMVPESLKGANEAKSLHRWQDESGKWQYANERPAELNAKVQEQAANYVDELNALKALPVVANEMARMRELNPPTESATNHGWIQKATGSVSSLFPGSG